MTLRVCSDPQLSTAAFARVFRIRNKICVRASASMPTASLNPSVRTRAPASDRQPRGLSRGSQLIPFDFGPNAGLRARSVADLSNRFALSDVVVVGAESAALTGSVLLEHSRRSQRRVREGLGVTLNRGSALDQPHPCGGANYGPRLILVRSSDGLLSSGG
jgi:hypothetical protein